MEVIKHGMLLMDSSLRELELARRLLQGSRYVRAGSLAKAYMI